MAEKVYLYVYDLSQGMAKAFSGQFLGKQIDGIWHTSIVVGGKEYYFSAGVQTAVAGHAAFGPPGEVIELGVTEIPSEVRDELIRDLSARFTLDTYNLLNNNCNNFSNELATMLTGTGIPPHILNLPAEVLSTPMGHLFRPYLDQLEGQLGSITEAQSQALVERPTIQKPPMQGQPLLNTEPAGSSSGTSNVQNKDKPIDKTMMAQTPSKDLFEAAVKREFTFLMTKGGLTPNQAAVMALQRVREQLTTSTASPQT